VDGVQGERNDRKLGEGEGWSRGGKGKNDGSKKVEGDVDWKTGR